MCMKRLLSCVYDVCPRPPTPYNIRVPSGSGGKEKGALGPFQLIGKKENKKKVEKEMMAHLKHNQSDFLARWQWLTDIIVVKLGLTNQYIIYTQLLRQTKKTCCNLMDLNFNIILTLLFIWEPSHPPFNFVSCKYSSIGNYFVVIPRPWYAFILKGTILWS